MKEFRDRVDVLFKVVLAVTGVVVGYFFSFQQQQNDDIELIVDLATADQSPKRIMGASIAKSYYEQKRIPRELFVAVFSYADSGGDQQLQAVVNTGAAAAVKKHANLRKALTKAGDSLPVRIYFHIRQEADREVARDIQRGVESALVPGGGIRSSFRDYSWWPGGRPNRF